MLNRQVQKKLTQLPELPVRPPENHQPRRRSADSHDLHHSSFLEGRSRPDVNTPRSKNTTSDLGIEPLEGATRERGLTNRSRAPKGPRSRPDFNAPRSRPNFRALLRVGLRNWIGPFAVHTFKDIFYDLKGLSRRHLKPRMGLETLEPGLKDSNP